MLHVWFYAARLPASIVLSGRKELMDYETFKMELMACLQDELPPGCKATVQNIEKLNGTSFECINLNRGNEEICPVVYFNVVYDMYKDGAEIYDIIEYIMRILQQDSSVQNEIVENIEDYDYMSDKVCKRLINMDRNRKLLETVPYIPLLDLAVVFYLEIIIEDGSYSFIITNEIFERWHISMDRLMSDADTNTFKCEKSFVRSLEEMLMSLSDGEWNSDALPETGLYVIGSMSGTYGAIYMTDMELLESIADKAGDDLIVIPSSVHEIMVAPAEKMARDGVDSIIHEVNENEVAEKDFLSDHSYLYSRKWKKIMM